MAFDKLWLRIVCTVTRKFSPVRIDENPVMNTPTTAGATAEFEYTVLSGV